MPQSFTKTAGETFTKSCLQTHGQTEPITAPPSRGNTVITIVLTLDYQLYLVTDILLSLGNWNHAAQLKALIPQLLCLLVVQCVGFQFRFPAVSVHSTAGQPVLTVSK